MNDVFGKKLGQYILLEQLGEGGMAKVYNALDSRVERNVAIKVILPSKRTSNVFLQQFEREAKVLANLAHTNIVKVLNYGVEHGQPYLVMEYVSGGTLKEAMNQKLPWQTAAAILAPIARALDYVHQQQIVHRDVKPSNILLQDDFRPMLSDFGILMLLESKEEKPDSAIGAGIGTPEYMPPEQGMGKDVDFRADIYSLGLVFYEMITGQKPYTADSPMAVIIKHVTDELPLPTRIDKNIPRFVERAILRAVQKDPKNRYISMGHFADVLELIALGDKASPQKINRAAREKEKRQRSISILSLSILLVVLVLGTSLLVYNYFNPARLVNTQPVAPVVSPQKTSTPTTPPVQTATLVSTEVAPISVTPQIEAGPGFTLLGTPINPDPVSEFTEVARWGIGGVNVVCWSPDGGLIALGTTSGIFLYDAQTKEETLFIDTEFNVLTMSFNLTGEEIAAGSSNGVVNTWKVVSGEVVHTYSYLAPPSPQPNTLTSRSVTAITYSPDGKNIAIGYQNGTINYFAADQSTVLALENYPTVDDIVISTDNRFIYATNGSRDIIVWDIQFSKKVDEPLSNPGTVNEMDLSNDQQYLVAGSGNSVYLWDFIDSEHVSSFSNLGGRVMDLEISYDDEWVAIALSTGEIKIFKMPAPADYSKTHVPALSFKGYANPILSLTASPTGLVVATGNHEEGLKLWDAQTGENTFTLGQSIQAINEIYLSGDGLWLTTSHEDSLVRVWNMQTSSEAYPAFEGYLPRGVPFSPDSRFLAYIYSPGGNRRDVIRVLDLKSGKVVAELPVPNIVQKGFVQFTDDSKLMVMGDAYSAKIWDVSTWEEVASHGGPSAGCGQYFTPHNNDLLSIISDGGITFHSFDQKIQAMCGTNSNQPEGTTFMYYFYAAHRMLFVLGSGELWTWDFVSEDFSRVKSASPYPLSREIFLAADQASGLYAYVEGGEVHIHNISSSLNQTIASQETYRYRVAFKPGGTLLALGSRYGSIHIWKLP